MQSRASKDDWGHLNEWCNPCGAEHAPGEICPRDGYDDLDRLLRIAGGNDIRPAAQRWINSQVNNGVGWDLIAQQLTAAALLHGRTYTTTPPPHLATREQAYAWARAEVDQARQRMGDVDAESSTPRALDLAEFLTVEFKPRENIMDPVFPRQGLGLVHAWRGLGKTHFAAWFAYGAAVAGPFLRWRAPRPSSVLYVDGEMRGVDMQQRMGEIVRASALQPAAGAFRIITPDLQPNGIPDLGRPEGQEWLDRVIEGSDLVVLDNLSSLVRSGTDKDDEPWLAMLTWLLHLRASGKSALLVHHDGKNEQQRGTSRREDQLDTVFHLKKPKDYREQDGARFVVHFEKHRGFYGKDAEPFEVALTTDEHGLLGWTMTDIEDTTTVQVADMLTAGHTVSAIAKDLGIGRATVDRHKKKAISRGLYDGQ